MRAPTRLLLPLTFGLALLFPAASTSPDGFLNFLEPASNQPPSHLENGPLKRRSDGCPIGYNSCSNMGAPGLCCNPNSKCAIDQAGHVACCPIGAACTGTIAAVSTVTSTQYPASTAYPTSTTNFISPVTTTTAAQTTAGGGVVIASSTTVAFVPGSSGASYSRSTVSNSYYPFAYIPTTYTNAAACSAAYSGCQTDLASCTAALGGGAHGVTISAPGGGVTVQAISATLDSSAASSVCSSLSLKACYGLSVTACQLFGTGTGSANGATKTGCGSPVYRYGAGVAIGIAAELLV